MSAPPSHPRRRRWVPPAVNTRFIRDVDLTWWRVRNLDRAGRQVQLASEHEKAFVWVRADDLARDWRQAA